jgi:predicted nucleic-acid-binding Zn-ribbon protein
MVLKMKPSCPKCGSENISNVTSRLPLRGGLRQTGKRWPENDRPQDKVIKPMTDFNHPYHCNSCGYYFGGKWGGGD